MTKIVIICKVTRRGDAKPTGSLSGSLGGINRKCVELVQFWLKEGHRHSSCYVGQTLAKSWSLSEREKNSTKSSTVHLSKNGVTW